MWEAIFNKMNQAKNTPTTGRIDDIQTNSSHASRSVFAHSWWTALYMHRWFKEKSPWVEGLSEPTAIASAFLHDISKASECNKSCQKKGNNEKFCWYDVYSPLNYEGRGDRIHPQVAAEILLGKANFCLCDQKHTCIKFSQKLIDTIFHKKVDLREVSLAAKMHWEIGELSRELNHDPPYKSRGKDLNAFLSYLDKFCKACRELGLVPSSKLLKLCIAVSFADIQASNYTNASCDTNTDLDKYCKPWEKELDEYYPTLHPWVLYRFPKRAKEIRCMLLLLFKQKLYKQM
jgi:hypothetical protein